MLKSLDADRVYSETGPTNWLEIELGGNTAEKNMEDREKSTLEKGRNP